MHWLILFAPIAERTIWADRFAWHVDSNKTHSYSCIAIDAGLRRSQNSNVHWNTNLFIWFRNQDLCVTFVDRLHLRNNCVTKTKSAGSTYAKNATRKHLLLSCKWNKTTIDFLFIPEMNPVFNIHFTLNRQLYLVNINQSINFNPSLKN
jgi:hypothetical protein